MKGSNNSMILFFLSVLLLCSVVFSSTHEVSVACMMAYDQGGARAVFSSQECAQWDRVHAIRSPHENTTSNCEFAAATIQGRRDYQEDRVVCNHAMKIPVLGRVGDEQKELVIGVAAVFDGHGGGEASELASHKFLDYFFLNVVFKTYQKAVLNKNLTGELKSDTLLRSILKEALIKTYEDIDSEVTEEALKNDYQSGSTGVVALLVNSQVLVGYVGDSKALLCADPTRADVDAKGTSSRTRIVEELTTDHNPGREDERARIEASGGFIRTWGVPRVNGILAMTRAIGDPSLRRFGVIAEPEVVGWRSLSSNDRFLVVGSDGIFEGLSPSNVCAVLNNNACIGKNANESSGDARCLALSTLANHIVYSAFENGSTDNISVVVIPLKSDENDSSQ